MADYLGKYTKEYLLLLAAELGISIEASALKKDICKAIKNDPDYDEGFTKNSLESIVIELKEKQKEKEREREFELEKMRVTNSAETNSMSSNATTKYLHGEKKINFKDLVPRFDPKVIDITLFLLIFERQAEKAKIEPEDWVSHLIPLLPMEIAEIIVREPLDKSDDYFYVKKILLKRFKLGTGALRRKFEGHQRKQGALWSDLVYELRGYLENWLESAEISDFDSLKELVLTEQLKKRVPNEMREKFMEEWEDINSANVLAEKCDKYENIKINFRKTEHNIWNKKPLPENKYGQANDKNRNELKAKAEGAEKKEYSKTESWKKDNSFERRKQIYCFLCKKPDHIKINCPEFIKKKTEKLNHMNNGLDLNECFEPYLKQAEINGINRNYLRDTGSSVDLCDMSWVDPKDLIGETAWIKQPLDEHCICLPLAWVNIKGDFGTVRTKAAIRPVKLDQGYYLLGNKTAELIANQENVFQVGAMITRSQAEQEKKKKSFQESEVENLKAEIQSVESRGESSLVRENEGGEELLSTDSFSMGRIGKERENSIVNIPEVESETELAKISASKFKNEQEKCVTLKKLWKDANEIKNEEFQVQNGKLVRISKSRHGEIKSQLCLPERYRQKIMELCHEEISGHLGTTKTKDRVLRYYYWPNCYKEIEDFVRTCDPCQRVGKSRDKKKAPLKLVPIISEVFSKICIDAVGPLPQSVKGNKYLLTSLCLASKYPDAIPMKNLSSISVIEALLQVFSRTGFPREIQSDLGSSFCSELTSEFFNKFNIKVSHSSVAHPMSQSVERVHSTLKRVLKALCLESGKDWEETLPLALFALRTVTHESTGFTPAELVHGKNLRMPHTLLYENWIELEEVNQTVIEYILNLMARLKSCQELAVQRMTESRDKRKVWYDRNAVFRKFKVGDQVLVLAVSKPNKMSLNWLGPGTVTGIISETNYTVDLPEKRDKNTIYHVNLMKPYYKRPEYINFMLELGDEEIERDAEIPYPLTNSTHLDFWELVKESNLEERVSTEQIGNFREVIERHERIFSSNPGKTHLVEMDIVLSDDIPVRSKPYRMSPRQTEILKEEIKRLLELGVIEVGQSDYASPMILVESPGKDPRPCVDYRKLNAKTRTEFFPLPNIDEVVEKVSSAEFITVMDLTKGYFQIPLTKRAQRYAAFVTPFGIFLPKVMMFGLLNSAYYFCMLIARVLGGLELFALPYIDDIAVFSLTWEKHLRDINEVLRRLGEAGLTVKPSKCRFAQDHVKFLGHEVGSGKRSPSEIKLQAIKDFPTPSNKTQLRAFLGTVGYYSRYIENYATIAVPLTDSLKGKIKKEKITWTNECDEAFKELKSKLMCSPVLYAPDFSKEFIVQADASKRGAGIVLSQILNGEEHPILYLSKKFSSAEQNYSTIERELAAIMYGLKKLNHYLDGQRFVIQTDHNPLTFLNKMMGSNSRLTRWALCLQQYNFRIEHKPGKLNGNADGLSRKD